MFISDRHHYSSTLMTTIKYESGSKILTGTFFRINNFLNKEINERTLSTPHPCWAAEADTSHWSPTKLTNLPPERLTDTVEHLGQIWCEDAINMDISFLAGVGGGGCGSVGFMTWCQCQILSLWNQIVSLCLAIMFFTRSIYLCFSNVKIIITATSYHFTPQPHALICIRDLLWLSQ